MLRILPRMGGDFLDIEGNLFVLGKGFAMDLQGLIRLWQGHFT